MLHCSNSIISVSTTLDENVQCVEKMVSLFVRQWHVEIPSSSKLFMVSRLHYFLYLGIGDNLHVIHEHKLVILSLWCASTVDSSSVCSWTLQWCSLSRIRWIWVLQLKFMRGEHRLDFLSTVIFIRLFVNLSTPLKTCCKWCCVRCGISVSDDSKHIMIVRTLLMTDVLARADRWVSSTKIVTQGEGFSNDLCIIFLSFKKKCHFGVNSWTEIYTVSLSCCLGCYDTSGDRVDPASGHIIFSITDALRKLCVFDSAQWTTTVRKWNLHLKTFFATDWSHVIDYFLEIR